MKRSLTMGSLVGLLVGLLASSLSLSAAISIAAPATSPELMPFTGSLRISRTWGEPSGGYHPYPAIDIGMSVGTPIYAAGAGVIVFVRNDARSCDPSMHATIPGSDQSGITWCIDNGFGNAGVWTEIKHPDGTFSLYGHLSALAAGTILGASVSAGQQIGLSGNTGITTGPHLHYEERNAAGVAIDPGKWVTCQGGSRIDYIDVQHLVGRTVRNDDYACIGSGTKPPPLPKPGTNALTSMAPARLLETRPELATIDNLFNDLGIRPAGSVTYLQVAGRAGVPADATAAVLNITVTNPRSDGFITVYPCGSPLPNASNLNYTTNQTTPNAVIAKIGDNGQVCIYTLAATHLITDINGYFPSGSPYTSMAPARLLETRPELATTDTGSNNGGSNNGGVRPAGSVTYLQVAGRAGVPADATAAVLNITVTNPRSDGFITVYPCGSPLPNASNLNYTTNQTTPNAVIAKIGDNGQVCIYTLAATHLITDINGYFPT